MIYALQNNGVVPAFRFAIAHEIGGGHAGAILHHVDNHDLVHIMDALPNGVYFCIYCLNPVRRSSSRAPIGQDAAAPWHFEHTGDGDTPGDCIGATRNPPTPHALGIVNPSDHGCYVQLGCEAGAAGNRPRTECQTISNAAHTYCHRAQMQGCL